jgi:raffinose/stachyose/melibiose transport system substrate-binding protein
MRNATKRTVASIAVSLLAASALVGFGTSAQAATEANTFTVAYPISGGGAASPYKALIEAFNAKYPQYEAKIQDTATESFPQDLVTKLRAGNAADIFMVQPGNGQINSLIPFVKAKFVADLSSTGAAKSNPKGAANALGVGGKTYAVALDQTAGAMIYNKTVLEADGLTWPTTFAGLLSACKVAREKGKTFFGLAGSMYANNGLMVMGMSGASVYATGDSWNVKRAAGKVSFVQSKEWRSVMTQIQQMTAAGCFQDGAAAGGFKDAIDDRFFAGKTYSVFVPGGTSVAFSNIPFMKKWTLKTAVFPGAKRLAVSSNYALAVNAKTKKLAAAKAFINFASTVTGQNVYQKVSGTLPVQAIDPAKLPVQYSEVIPYLQKGLTYGFPNQSWGAPEVYVRLGTGIQGLLTGRAIIDQVLLSVDRAWK